MAVSCKYGDEPAGSVATELVIERSAPVPVEQACTML
jgi:hypothetical protein